jgi:hypothetical protein
VPKVYPGMAWVSFMACFLSFRQVRGAGLRSVATDSSDGSGVRQEGTFR